MILYIAFVSTLNLCLGYALGVYFGVLPGISRNTAAIRKTKPSPVVMSEVAIEEPEQNQIEADTALKDLPEETQVAEEKDNPPESDLQDDSTANESATAAADESTSNSTQDPTISSDTPEPEESEAEDEGEQVLPEAAPSEVEIGEFMNGLSEFQEQISEIDRQLQSEQSDAAQVAECADQLQDAGREYVDHANQVFDDLAPNANDTVQVAEEKLLLKQSIMDQAQRVKHEAAERKSLDLENDLEGAKSVLKEASESLSSDAEELAERLSELVATSSAEDVTNNDKSDTDSETSQIGSRESVAEMVDEWFGREAREGLYAAVVELDGTSNNAERVLAAIENLVEAEVDENQKAAHFAERQLILLMERTTADFASETVERIRQRIEAGSFILDGSKLATTVSCALVGAADATDRESLEIMLQETMTEAKRYGANHTFLHDGDSAVPVVPPDLAVEASEISV